MKPIDNNTNKDALRLKKFLRQAPKMFVPGVSVDTVIFSYHNNRLHVLLLHFKDLPYRTLPGGFIKKEEDLDEAALRILQERTGLANICLEQFYTSGKANRTEKNMVEEAITKRLGQLPANTWTQQRFISVCYYALVDETKVQPEPGPFTNGYSWVGVKKLPPLLYDHAYIIEKALQRLQADLDQKLAGFNPMNDTFTMNDLQKLYEAVYQKKLVRTNFQRKMLGLGVLERLEKQYNGKAHKAPYLYRFVQAT